MYSTTVCFISFSPLIHGTWSSLQLKRTPCTVIHCSLANLKKYLDLFIAFNPKKIFWLAVASHAAAAARDQLVWYLIIGLCIYSACAAHAAAKPTKHWEWVIIIEEIYIVKNRAAAELSQAAPWQDKEDDTTMTTTTKKETDTISCFHTKNLGLAIPKTWQVLIFKIFSGLLVTQAARPASQSHTNYFQQVWWLYIQILLAIETRSRRKKRISISALFSSLNIVTRNSQTVYEGARKKGIPKTGRFKFSLNYCYDFLAQFMASLARKAMEL